MSCIRKLCICEAVFALICIVQFIVSVIFVSAYLPLYKEWVAEPLDAGYIQSSNEGLIKCLFLLPVTIFVVLSIVALLASTSVLYSASQKIGCKCWIVLLTIVTVLVGLLFCGLRVGLAVAESKVQPIEKFQELNISQNIVRLAFHKHPEGFLDAKEKIDENIDEDLLTKSYMGFTFKEGIIEWASIKATNLWSKIQADHRCCGDQSHEDYLTSLWYLYWGSKIGRAVPSSCCAKSDAGVCGEQDKSKSEVLNKIINNIPSANDIPDFITSLDITGCTNSSNPRDCASSADSGNTEFLKRMILKLLNNPNMKKQLAILAKQASRSVSNPDSLNKYIDVMQPLVKELERTLNITTPQGLEVIYKTGCRRYFESWAIGILQTFKLFLTLESCWLALMSVFLIGFACRSNGSKHA